MAKLTLVPTPISDDKPWDAETTEVLRKAFLDGSAIVVEEHKIARRKWIANGLPREAIDNFICLNEHTKLETNEQILGRLKSGVDAYLMSDCGLPAFCDPGQELVDLCHINRIKVTALNFPNSVILALTLSGFKSDTFFFGGFIPRDSRLKALKQLDQRKEAVILMDTPYRLSKVLEELRQIGVKRQVFVGIDLNCESETLVRGDIEQVVKDLNNVNKREFVLVLGPYDGR